MTLTLSFKKDSGKGLSPGEYLRSALYGGEATNTIHSAIQNITGLYPYRLTNLKPWELYPYGHQALAAKVISGSRGNYVSKQQPASGERFVAAVTGPSRRFATSARGGLKETLYRIKGNKHCHGVYVVQQKTTLSLSLTMRALSARRLPTSCQTCSKSH